MTRRRVSILGATGSVGTSTLDLVERNPDRFEVIALTAARNVAALADAARRTSAKLAVIDDPSLLSELEERLSGSGCRAATGPEALNEAAAGEAELVMAAMTPEQAVAHPNWSMGAKISVDSATMMNKGLELIEAHHLFNLPSDRIEILVHPQSVVHSMVEYVDGSVLAQMGSPDMRIPIAYALAYPERIETPAERLDLGRIGSLTFEVPDSERFPALRLARQALEEGGAAPIVLNAANEEAVAAFLGRRIAFLDICQTVEEALHRTGATQPQSIAEVIDIDRDARALANELMRELAA
jgi:1-deoxy-D-xylulose 5-phosphate reductoisomerase